MLSQAGASCAAAISAITEPFLEQRLVYEGRPDDVLDILIDGEKRARIVAETTMNDVRRVMSLG